MLWTAARQRQIFSEIITALIRQEVKTKRKKRGRGLPAGQFGGQLGEQVAGSTAAGLGERRGVVGEGGGGRRSVVGGGAAVPQLPTVEGAAACCASGEAEAVRRGGVGDAVGRRHRVPRTTG